jgi:outer membrane protein TolC
LADTLDTLAQPISTSSTLADSIKTAETQRPDLAAAMKQMDAAKESLRESNGAYSPQVYAVGMADEMSAGGSAGHIGYTVGLTASIPIYDGGERNSDVDSAKSAVEKATLNAQSVRQTVDQDVATAWLNNGEAATEVQAAQTGVTAAQQAYNLADLRYNAGKSVAAERLDALSALTRAKGDLATATSAAIEAHVRLLTAMDLSL